MKTNFIYLSGCFDKSISKLPKNHSEHSGGAHVSAAHSRAFSLKVASFAPTYKLSETLQALRARFFAGLGRFGAPTCSPEAPQDAPGLDFRARNDCFFEVFASDERSTRKTSDIDKTLAGAIRNALRSCCASTKNVRTSNRKRFQLHLAMPTALPSVLGVVPEALGASLGRPGDAYGRLLVALGPPGASPDWPWGGTLASKNCPERVRTRSQNGLGRPNRPLIVFRTIFRSFWLHFHGFSIDFSSIFARAACDEGTKSESQKRVA